MNIEWINVKHELPTPYEKVLTFTSDESDSHVYVEPIRFSFMNKSNEWISECTGDVEDCTITHWMKLPAPPKEKIDQSLYLNKYFIFHKDNTLPWSQDFCCFSDNAPHDIQFLLYKFITDERVFLRAHGYGIISNETGSYGNGSICMEIKDIINYMVKE